jgi:hypothetical protein
VVGAAVVLTTGGVVVGVVGGVVVAGAWVVVAGVGIVVGTVVNWVVTGAGPDGDVQPAMTAAMKSITPKIPGPVLDRFMLIGDSSPYNPPPHINQMSLSNHVR